MESPCKNAWPELVGVDGNCAVAIIEKENKHVEATILKDGTPVTKDFRCDRVWVWVNKIMWSFELLECVKQ
ncbi:hypothetical protein MANES_05G086322v8 [Manihot esculenta]|uniref:Uncharacterized protein n=1 Tax=Manihot esculenta TaxID=3983 RepID=A0ACB7HPV4_MANES|nr:hypothetical protein MANES_05G086322v8 [Manihot esculenta]